MFRNVALGAFFAVAISAIAAAGYFLSGSFLLPPKEHQRTIRYKETLYFSRGSTQLAASGVSEANLYVGSEPLTSGINLMVRYTDAQAIPIDIGNGQTLFAMPNYPIDAEVNNLLLLVDACHLRLEPSQDPRVLANAIDEIATVTGDCSVPKSSLPILVYFKDINDPYSIERVLPDDLPKVFLGLQLDHATVALTTDPPSLGIDKKIPWLMSGTPGTGLRIKTVEKHPRSNPIVLEASDFWKRQ